MKHVSPALQAVLAAPGNMLARCWQIVTRRGEVLGFTRHTRDLVVEGVTYASLWGVRDAALETHEGLTVGNQDVSLFLSRLNARDIDAGRYDLATIQVFEVDPQQPEAGTLPHKVGVLGNISRRDGQATLEVRGPSQFLQSKLGEVFTATCPVRLGSPRCGVELADVSVTNAWELTSAAGTLRVEGLLMAQSGFAPGQVIEVQDSTSNDGVYVLATVEGDTLTVTGALPGSDETTLCTVIRRNGYIYQGTIASVDPNAPRRIFTTDPLLDVEGVPPPPLWFQEGNVQCTSGENVGVVAHDIRTQSGVTFTLYEEFPFDLAVGDTVVLEVGCSKRFTEDCIEKFNNAVNFQGFPYVPVPEETFNSPVSF